MEAGRVGGPCKRPRRHHLAQAHATDQGHRLPLPRHATVDPLALGGAAVGAGHRRRCPHLVDEDQLLWVKDRQLRTELLPLLLDVRAAALVGATYLLLAGDLELAQRPPE